MHRFTNSSKTIESLKLDMKSQFKNGQKTLCQDLRVKLDKIAADASKREEEHRKQIGAFSNLIENLYQKIENL
jgi:hypothetical protein